MLLFLKKKKQKNFYFLVRAPLGAWGGDWVAVETGLAGRGYGFAEIGAQTLARGLFVELAGLVGGGIRRIGRGVQVAVGTLRLVGDCA
jgi:hypothetical protein